MTIFKEETKPALLVGILWIDGDTPVIFIPHVA